MSSFSIVTDSACDLTTAYRDRFGIDGYISSSVIFPDGRLVEADPDWNNITPEAFYGSMVDKKQVYKSATPGTEQISKVFKEQLNKGKDILCIVLSSGMSAIYNHCCTAAEDILKEYPERKIRVIDSKRYSTAVGQLCLVANALREQGKSLQETADWIEDHIDRFHQSGWIDDLFFLARAGRLSKGTAFMGTMIGVKPIADFNMDTGMFQVIGKARGTARALKAVIQYIKETIEEPEKQILFVANSFRADYAKQLAELIQKEIKPMELIMNSIGQSCGANIGPGLVVAFYYGKPLSKELAGEAALMQTILKQA